MNISRHLTHLTMIAATLAAGFVAQAADGAGQRTVQLETVVVTGHREAGGVVYLPAVVVTGKLVQAPTLLAQKNPRGAATKG